LVKKISSHLLTLGFRASPVDPSLFFYQDGATVIFLLFYVDDIILMNSDSVAITKLVFELAHAFELKDLGPLKYFLGLQIDYIASGSLFINQSMRQISWLGLICLHASRV
jgi:hypothetical protein